LTDLNPEFLDEGRPGPNEWRLIRMVPNEAVPAGQIERIKRRLPLPPGARGVIVDSGRSVHFVITGDPVGERVLESTLGEESSFDCWIRESGRARSCFAISITRSARRDHSSGPTSGQSLKPTTTREHDA
jgi:hypothetical protein